MKNLYFLISLLLLTTLLHEAQGMKSRKLLTKTTDSTSTSSSKNRQRIEENASEAEIDGKMSKSSSNKLRGLQVHEKIENLWVKKSSPVVKQRQAPPKRYPDVVDLAGMDYSPARRKSPIHN